MTSDDYYCDSILSGRVSVEVVAETENVPAFRHVFPSWEVHILVIPKAHVRSLAEVEDPSLFAELFQVVVRIIRERRLAETNYKAITNGGSYQSQQHLHTHLVSGNPLDPGNPAQQGELRA